MIDLRSQLAAIEELMILMAKHEIDELSCDFLNLKKSRHKPARPQLTEKELLDQHLKPLPDEPWNQIPQEEADTWAQGNAPPGRSDT